MKKFLWIFSSALLLSVAFLNTGCGDDPVDDLAPIVSITAGPTPASVVAGTSSTVTVTVEATKGTKALKAVTVYQGADKVEVADLTIDGAAAASNPVLITSPTDVMTWDIAINVSADAGTVTYSVKVEDEGGLSDEAPFDVLVEAALEATITGVDINLYNQAGPVGTGAIDLETGNGTGTTDVTADLRDMGIDSLAGSGDNWNRRIGGINGTVVRSVSGFTSADFGAVASKDAIALLYTNGTDLTGTLPTWGSFPVSEVVSEGDVFVVYKSSSSTYFLVIVNTVTETIALGNNTDHYNVSIKY